MDDIRAEVLKMWRSSWENSVKNLTMVQEQGNKMFDLLFNQSETIQTETKKLIKEGLTNAQEAQKSYFQAMEENLKKIEELLAQK